MPHVQSRLILNFSGFEPSSNQRLLGRILYSIDKAKQLWGIETKVLETTSHQNKPHSVCQLDAAGENWKISARIVQLGFGEIVGKYQVDSNPYLLVKNFLKYLTLLFDGTFIKYVRLTILFWVFFYTHLPYRSSLVVFHTSQQIIYFVHYLSCQLILLRSFSQVFCFSFCSVAGQGNI